MTSTHRTPQRSPRRAFSLIEVSIALGVISFSLVSVLSLLPMGLKSVRDSANETALSAIVRSVRAELNQASFSDVTTGLPAQTWYFNESGNRLGATAPASDRFFQLSFSASLPLAAGAADAFGQSLRALTLTVRYPAFAPVSAQQTNAITLLSARQSSKTN